MRDDRFFMGMALKLAERAKGQTSPNPMVGALIVKNNRIEALGYHKKAGLEHAEAAALKKAGPAAKGATLYVNLEPCSHYGRTPPCAEAIIKSGIKKVVAAMKDPNPINNGRGFAKLRGAGIRVVNGVMEQEAKRLNEFFIKHITTGRPFVIVKMAQSMDGKIATRTGESKWISSEVSRRLVHKLREQVDAVMVGANTVVKDDPLLAVTSHKSQVTRSKEKNPIKVIVDTRLRVPLSAKIFSKESPTKVILATTQKAPKRKIGHFEKMNCEILMLNEKDGGVDLEQLMRELGEREITSVLAEGGGELIGSLVEKRLVDKFLFFIAPRIIGGRDAVTSVEGQGAGRINKALNLKIIERKNTGRDLLIVCSPE